MLLAHCGVGPRRSGCPHPPTWAKPDNSRRFNHGRASLARPDARVRAYVCVPSMFRQLEGESPFDNLMEVKS